MEVTVNLYATLTRYHPEEGSREAFKVDLPEGATLEDLYRKMGIEEGEVKKAFIRHKSRLPDYTLEDGDRVGIFPPVGGG